VRIARGRRNGRRRWRFIGGGARDGRRRWGRAAHRDGRGRRDDGGCDGGRGAHWRLARVRLAAEAFSYLTLRGIAGEPLKVVLLADDIDPRIATAAVALERIAYLIGTTVIVGVGSILAIAMVPLTHTWFRVFRAFAIAAGVVSTLTVMVLAGPTGVIPPWGMV